MPQPNRKPPAQANNPRGPAFRIKSTDIAEDGTFSGYASVWGVVDSYGDIVLPGAFTRSLEAHAASGDRVKMLWQHLPEEPNGVWLEMREDDHGLWCRGQLLTEIRRGAETLVLLRHDAISGLSIGYETIDSTNASAEEVKQSYGYDVADGTYRMLHEVDLWEISVVTFPALAVAQVDSVKRPKFKPAPGPGPQPIVTRDPHIDALAAAIEQRGRLLDRLL
jgi:uncharacterized protein